MVANDRLGSQVNDDHKKNVGCLRFQQHLIVTQLRVPINMRNVTDLGTPHVLWINSVNIRPNISGGLRRVCHLLHRCGKASKKLVFCK